jgi:subtilisin family serine protease
MIAEAVMLEDGDEVVIDLMSEQVIDWGVKSIGAPDAWKETQGEGVRVGVIDTGGTQHKDVVGNVDKVWGDLDTEGHGTHVAGIIGAANNTFGVVGVAPLCRLSLYKALPGDTGTIAGALIQAANDGMQVINMSLGAYADDERLHDVIKELDNAGIVIVAAAGNDPTRESWPGQYPEVLAVSALSVDGKAAPFAPLIPNHVAMPGVDILSTWLDDAYAKLSGTSMATPLMTGTIALMLKKYAPSPGAVHDLVHRELTRIEQENEYFWYTPRLGLLCDVEGNCTDAA